MLSKTALKQYSKALSALHARDRKIVAKIVGRAWKGEFASVDEAIRSANETHGGKAFNWSGIATLLNNLLPVVLQIVSLFK